MVEAVDRTKGRRLSGSVRPDERDDLAGAYFERDALQRVDRPVVRVDVVELEDDALARRDASGLLPVAVLLPGKLHAVAADPR
jgi:hypothetical protein